MCLPFSCGGGDKGDDWSHDSSSVHHHFRQPPQPQPPPPPREDEKQPYYKPPPEKEAYGHHGTNMPAGGGDGMNNGGARAAEVNKNGGGHTTDFGYSDGNVHASVGVFRGRESQSAAGKKIVASTAPAMQAFNNKHRDMAAAQQAPQGTYVVSASPRQHHGHGSSAASISHPSEAADSMKAPLQVLPMGRRGPEDY